MDQLWEQRGHFRCLEHREARELCARVESEFREMPDLRLTVRQASRLFRIEPAQCHRVLGALVLAGQLATDGHAFASPRSGRRSA